MKKITLTILLSCLIAFLSFAQDARQRTTTTIVQDALAQLPAGNAEDFNVEMKYLAESAPESVTILAGMLAPEGEGQDSHVEYAINGLVNYASANLEYVPAVKKGLAQAILLCGDIPDKAFLIAQLALIADGEDIPVFVEALRGCDEKLKSPIMNAMIPLEGSEDAFMELMAEGQVDCSLFAYAAAKKHIAAAEPILLEQLEQLGTAGNADLKKALCSALSQCGTSASAKTLESASKTDYAVLLKRLAASGDIRTALSGAKSLMKEEDSNLRVSAMEIILGIKGKSGIKDVVSAMKSPDRAYRNAVLGFADAFACKELYDALAGKYKSFPDEVKVDILNWCGENRAVPMLDVVLASFSFSKDVAVAAIRAAGMIGGDAAADALFAELGGDNSDAAYCALISFKGDLTERTVAALETDGKAVLPLMSLASEKRMKKAADRMLVLAGSDNPEIRSCALENLAGVVSPQYSDVLAAMLDKASDTDASLLRKAFNASISALDGEEQFAVVKKAMSGASAKERFYSALAQSGTDAAVEELAGFYADGHVEAFKALSVTDNYKAADVLYDIAVENDAVGESVVPRLIALTGTFEKNMDSAYARYSRIMTLCKSAGMRKKVLDALSGVPTRKAFLLASKYLDDERTAYAAAQAVKNIAAKTEEEIDYGQLVESLTKASGIYAAAGGADDGYAVDEIKKMLDEAEPSPVFVLPEDEKAQGFEVLFDGTDLSKWVGDKEGYTPLNGTIYVSASYGDSRNLYTVDEYSDFVLRFEFCFTKPGVNNGVGIRTPMGKDAAYYGMCEVQILDHDDPIYKDLREYQVHGSAYGIIPAKRIKHKPLGEWSTEEIRVVGDHVTVTLNGEVILDGNLRKACKGHNVAPDGGNNNPYTVDHRNHPGMFNKSGHVGFLGHGEGIKFRNVRILDLSKKK